MLSGKNCRNNSTIIELHAHRANGRGVRDIMLKTPRLGLRAARNERGTGTLVAVREERHVWPSVKNAELIMQLLRKYV